MKPVFSFRATGSFAAIPLVYGILFALCLLVVSVSQPAVGATVRRPKLACLAAMGTVIRLTNEEREALEEDYGKKAATELVRPVEGRVLGFLRTNVPWSWAWYKRNYKDYFEGELREIAEMELIVGGDVKPDNVGDSFVGGKRRFILLDVDDGGIGSALGEFWMTASYMRKWLVPVKFKHAWKAYLDGLEGKDYELPEVLERALEASRKEERRRQEHFLEKVVSRARLVPEELDAVRIEEASTRIRSVYELGKATFESELPHGWKILDRVVRVKPSGSNAGLPRFIYLIESKQGVRKVVEFKMNGDPAVSRWRADQPLPEERLRLLRELYRDGEKDPGSGLVRVGDYVFFKHPKTKEFVKGDRDPESGKEENLLEEYDIYMFNWLGKRHRKQGQAGKAYAKAVAKNEEALAERLKRMVKDRIELAEELHLETKP